MGAMLCELLPCDAGASSGAALGQARQLASQAALPSIRERRPSGLRRFWGSSSASSRAPSVASQASSEQDLAEDVGMGRRTSHEALPRRMAGSPGSSASSDLDSAQGRPTGLSKVCHAAVCIELHDSFLLGESIGYSRPDCCAAVGPVVVVCH